MKQVWYSQLSGNLPDIDNHLTIKLDINEQALQKPCLIIYNDSYFDVSGTSSKRVIFPKTVAPNVYQFELGDETKPYYFDLVLNGRPELVYILENYHFEPGDRININLNAEPGSENHTLEFNGEGAGKYNCQSEFATALLRCSTRNQPLLSRTGVFYRPNKYEENIEALLGVVEKYRPELSDFSYNLFKADVIAEYGRAMVLELSKRIAVALNKDDRQVYLRLLKSLTGLYDTIGIYRISAAGKYASKGYAHYLVDKIICKSLKKNSRIDIEGVFNLINRKFTANLKDKMIAILFLKYHKEMKDDCHALLDYAMSTLNNKECLDKLKAFKMLNW